MKLSHIEIPDATDKIGDQAFSECPNLDKGLLPSRFKDRESDIFGPDTLDSFGDDLDIDALLSQLWSSSNGRTINSHLAQIIIRSHLIGQIVDSVSNVQSWWIVREKDGEIQIRK